MIMTIKNEIKAVSEVPTFEMEKYCSRLKDKIIKMPVSQKRV